MLLLFTVFNLFQTWQYNNYIIDSERMTQKYYWEVFGKTVNNPNARQYLSPDRGQETFSDYENYNEKYFKKEASFMDFEKPINGDDKNIIDSTAASGKNSYLLKDAVMYSPAFEQKYNDITSKSYVWIRTSVWVYLTAPYTESNSGIVISIESKGKPYKYITSDYKNFKITSFVWNEIHLEFLTPEIRHKSDIVKAYFWNMGNKPVLIDNFKIEIFEPKQDYE